MKHLTLMLGALLFFGCHGGGDGVGGTGGAGPGGAGGGPPAGPMGPAMASFESEQAFDDYMNAYPNPDEDNGSGGDGSGSADAGVGDEGGEGGAGGGDGAAAPANEEITNNQESGVDEGGIVKHIGDHLVVLRKGRLFAADISEPGAPRQTASLPVAETADLNQGVWYDEMLVRGQAIFVIGYRFAASVVDRDAHPMSWIYGATEIASFVLDADGRLARRGTTFIESNDYFSGSNYASRMISGHMVLYMPYAGFVWDWSNDVQQRKIHIPQVLEHRGDNQFVAVRPLFDGTDVARPVTPPAYPVFHTLVDCAIDADAELACQAKSVLGEWGSQFYVTRSHVFVWTDSQVYALSLDDDSARAHAVRGWPTDQFAFKAEADALNVVVYDHQYDAEAAPEDNQPEIVRLRLPFEAFDAAGAQDVTAKRQVLTRGANIWLGKQRYVDGWYLGAVEDWSGEGEGGRVIAHRLSDGTTHQLGQAGNTSRIEAMPGVGALLVSQADGDLVVRSLLLEGDAPVETEPTRLEGLNEGESRSHGFFFKPGETGGRFGLAILGNFAGDPEAWWGGGVSNLAFFDVGGAGDIAFGGAISASDAANGACETSCVDWYGNTRPIFLGDRAFALMGHELAEVAFDDGARVLGARLALE